MILKAKPRRTLMDVSLANFDTYEPYSDQVMIVRDLSVYTKSNLLPKRSDHIETKVDNLGKLKFTNSFSSIEVSDISGFEIDTFVSSPLWYKYTFSYAYYNKTKITQRITKSVDLDKNIRSVERLNSEQKKAIISSSVSLRYTAASNNLSIDYSSGAENTSFIVDYAKRDVIYTGNTFGGLDPQGRLRVSYSTIDLDIEHELDDPSTYLFLVKEIDTNIYTLTILSSFRMPIKIRYNTIQDEQPIQIEEIASFEPIFLETDTFTGAIDEIAFRKNGNDVYVTPSNIYKEYFVRQKILTNTRVYIQSPTKLPRYEQWFLKISRNFFNYDNRTYSTNFGLAYEAQPYLKSEQSTIIDANRIALSQLPKYIRTKDGIEGIQVFNQFNDLYKINEIDENDYILTLDGRISPLDIITSIYEYDDELMSLSLYDFNPRNSILNDFDLLKRVMVVFILPEQELYDPTISVFVGYLPRYDMGQEIEYTDEYILSTMTASDVYPIVSQYVNTTDLHPIALAIITIDNVYLPRISVLKDVRNRGGGARTSINADNKMVGDDIFHQFDIGCWDGENFDLAGILIFRIPLTVQNYLLNLFLTCDQDVIFLPVPQREVIARRKMEVLVSEIIEKRKPIGKRALIEYLSE